MTCAGSSTSLTATATPCSVLTSSADSSTELDPSTPPTMSSTPPLDETTWMAAAGRFRPMIRISTTCLNLKSSR
ncbi:unnamed protein product [Linum tenue]|uniref:Uncharacterized protein n=1 Tax=Linum tenue TaxID=586396 RepID=A0AAV0JYX2_9ROSI|nr:unnamed protein product [Linum tenue]